MGCAVIDDEAALVGAGHNSGTLRDQAVEEQSAELERYRDRAAQFIAAAERAVVCDRASAGSATDIIRLAGQVWTMIDTARRARSDPFREAQLAVKGVVDEFWQPVREALAALLKKIETWDEAEEERIRAQRLEQAAEMQRLQARAPSEVAPAPTLPARPRKVRGDLGGQMIRGESMDYEVIDITAVPRWILEEEPVKRAVLNVVRSVARHQPGEIPGIRATPVSIVRVS
jgi:hypothetical protein